MPRFLLAALVLALIWMMAFREGLDVWSALAGLVVSAGAVLLAVDQRRTRRPVPEPTRRGPTRV